ncbi:Alpha/Beta hydrolase protein, partial [Flammula alnicola]
KGRGYSAEHSTQPQTLGYSLADSPVGLLAWIYEKLVIDDEVLTWISIYCFSRAGPAASVRIYYEVDKATPGLFTTDQPTTIPLGYSYFPKELVRFPKSWLKARNLVFQSEHESGGHFAAHEKPQELDGPAFGVVPARRVTHELL